MGDETEQVHSPISTPTVPPGYPRTLPPSENRLTRYRFCWLLAALLSFFIVVPLTHEFRAVLHPGILFTVETAMFVCLIGGVSLSISRTRAWKLMTLLMGVPAVLLWLVHLIDELPALELIRYLLGTGFIGYAIVLMLVTVFTARKVTMNVLCACLCGYVMLGIVWALSFSVLSLLIPHSFTATLQADGPVRLRVGPHGSMDAMYFSFTTLTTLGYGDIVPRSPMARAMACLEALVGQLYLAVLVARLVGLHIVHAVGGTGPELERD